MKISIHSLLLAFSLLSLILVQSVSACPHLDLHDAAHQEKGGDFYKHFQFGSNRYDYVNALLWEGGKATAITGELIEQIFDCEFTAEGRRNNSHMIQDAIKHARDVEDSTVFTDAHARIIDLIRQESPDAAEEIAGDLREGIRKIFANNRWRNQFRDEIEKLSSAMAQNVKNAQAIDNTIITHAAAVKYFGEERFDIRVKELKAAQESLLIKLRKLQKWELFKKTDAGKIVLDETIRLHNELFPYDEMDRAEAYFKFIEQEPTLDQTQYRIKSIQDAIDHLHSENDHATFSGLINQLEEHKTSMVDLSSLIEERNAAFELLDDAAPDSDDFRELKAAMDEVTERINRTGLVACIKD